MMSNRLKEKIISPAAVLVLLFSFSCSQPKKNDKLRIEKINGVTHVFNPSSPLKGVVTLELGRVKRGQPTPLNGVFF
jgi:hypothetical protein